MPKGKRETEKETEKESATSETEPNTAEVNSISDLSGVGDATEAKLREAGYDTVEMLSVLIPDDLTALGIESAQARKVLDAARKATWVEPDFKTGLDVMKEHEARFRLSSHVPAWDEMIGRGFEASTVTIIHGKYGSGKSSVCHWLTACALVEPAWKQNLSKDDATVVYIDTENTFRPERVIDHLQMLGGDKSDLARIIHADATSSLRQMSIVDHAGKVIKEKHMKFLILDSLTAHYRSEYIGREMLARRQQMINHHLQRISQLTRMFNLVTLVTTQEIDMPAQGFAGAAESKAAGGNVALHRPLAIFSIWRPEGLSEKRFLTLEKHPSQPQRRIVLKLDEKGFHDFEAQEKK